MIGAGLGPPPHHGCLPDQTPFQGADRQRSREIGQAWIERRGLGHDLDDLRLGLGLGIDAGQADGRASRTGAASTSTTSTTGTTPTTPHFDSAAGFRTVWVAPVAVIMISSIGIGARRLLSTTTKVVDGRVPIDKCRNFGIIAHIDAGKTTISERILYYSGRTRHIGEVHDGDTVMDHMAEERKRGITITSSCISLHWQGHRLNLIDSPGHVDFTVEVERCMRVLDGAVTVIDAVAGVQVQTETVWNQADKYHVPRIIFVNKMDRDGADLDLASKSIRDRLGVTPWVLQRPLERDGRLVGVVDLVSLTAIEFNGPRGEHVHRYPVGDVPAHVLARDALLDLISDQDETVLETLLDSGNVTAAVVEDAVRRAVRDRRPIVPVLCGAAYRNIGVQPLLDAVCSYLPSPVVDDTSRLRALIFKIVHDGRRGPIAFTRVYSGTLSVKDTLRVRGEMCRVGKLLQVDSGDYEEISGCRTGDICAIIGLKHIRTGDMIYSWQDRDQDQRSDQIEINIPEPVFFCSIEAESSQDHDELKLALQALSQEDPSLHVTFDHDTGQTVIKGMGELHLEIVQERLRNEFKLETVLGPMSVAYRETPSMDVTETVTHQIPGRPPVSVTMTLRPSDDNPDIVTLDQSEARLSLAGVTSQIPADVRALTDEMISGLRGPLLGFPLCRAQFTLHTVTAPSQVTSSEISAAVSHCVAALLRSSQVTLLEPIVELELHCRSSYIGDISADLTGRRRGQVLHVTSTGDKGLIVAYVPLVEIVGYSTSVRSISQGTAYYSTRFKTYDYVPDRQLNQLLHTTS